MIESRSTQLVALTVYTYNRAMHFKRRALLYKTLYRWQRAIR